MRKLFIDLKINGELVSLEKYNATLVGYEFTPSSPTIQVEQSSKGVRQIVEEDYNYNPDSGYIQFLIIGRNHENTDLLLRKIIGDFIDVDFRISSQTYWRTFVQTSVEVKWLDYEKRVVVTLNGNSYCWGYEKFTRVIENGQEIFVDSPRPTPLIYTIEAVNDTGLITIDGMSIFSLNEGETMTIDSYYCRVTVDGENAMQRVTIYDFPLAKGVHKVSVSDLTNIKLKISWRPRL